MSAAVGALRDLGARPAADEALAASTAERTSDGPAWARIAAMCASAALAAVGYMANSALPCPALRAQVATAVGSLACAAVMAERWAAAPERVGRGGLLAALAGALAAAASMA